MQTIEQLRDKIDAAEGLQQVVRTMKGLAAVNIRQYQRADESLEVYAETVDLGLQILLRAGHDRLRIRTDAEADGAVLAMVFGSDQGMVGQFNRRIYEHYQNEMAKTGADRDSRMVLVVGRRLAGRMESEGEPVVDTFDLPRSAEHIAPNTQQMISVVQQLREQGARTVLLMHHLPDAGASYHAVTRHVFPISLDWLSDLAEKPWPGPSLPMFRIDAEVMLARLVNQYLFVSLFRAFAGSLAAENASRLASMQAAESNIDDRLDHLRHQYHQRRQSQITSELLDVMAGFEAARDNEKSEARSGR